MIDSSAGLVVVFQLLSYVHLFAIPWTVAHQTSLSFTVAQSLIKLMSIELMMPSNHLILSPPSPPALHLSQLTVFSNESILCINWPKYWSFSISPSNEYSELISIRIDWFDLALQGTFKSLLQYHHSKASILVLSLLYGPTLTFIHD